MDDNIKVYLNQFQQYLGTYDKDCTIEYSMSLLSEKKITVQELYEKILTPSLNSISMTRAEEASEIWKEHLMTNIVRTIIECAYPYVLKEKQIHKGEYKTQRVIIVCPEEEYHEIGARMGADFFVIMDYEVFYIGCNTPKETLYSAIETLHPDVIAISITNTLNLVSLKRIVKELKEKTGSSVKILLSGSAFIHANKSEKDFNADGLVLTLKDIELFRRNQHETSI